MYLTSLRACPYTLTPSQCGHTFCALCILKWFLSRIHQQCGGWHESVDCPICRTLLTLTPPIPRPEITFPFVPNRALDLYLRETVAKLATAGSTSGSGAVERGGQSKVKQELSGSRKVQRESAEKLLNLPAEYAWKEGGALRMEWLKRDRLVYSILTEQGFTSSLRDGRAEMQSVSSKWSNLGPQDFLVLKARLRV